MDNVEQYSSFDHNRLYSHNVYIVCVCPVSFNNSFCILFQVCQAPPGDRSTDSLTRVTGFHNFITRPFCSYLNERHYFNPPSSVLCPLSTILHTRVWNPESVARLETWIGRHVPSAQQVRPLVLITQESKSNKHFPNIPAKGESLSIKSFESNSRMDLFFYFYLLIHEKRRICITIWIILEQTSRCRLYYLRY